MATSSGVSLQGALLRMVFAVLLVLATFNPSGYSFAHWIVAPPVSVTPGKALAALALVIGWLMCLRTAFIALGRFGLLLGVALFAALVWLLVDRQVLSLTGSGIVWAGLLVVGLLLGVGLSWSLVRAQVTGHVEVQ
ncbi:MAG: DUF6524 family protein [Vicinamibacterales bacterium]